MYFVHERIGTKAELEQIFKLKFAARFSMHTCILPMCLAWGAVKSHYIVIFLTGW